CAPGERLQPGKDAPKVPETTGENLSDKLARNDGVLCPPNVDPDIKAPTPETGKMPVIPPPGSPGGDQNVRPKWRRTGPQPQPAKCSGPAGACRCVADTTFSVEAMLRPSGLHGQG